MESSKIGKVEAIGAIVIIMITHIIINLPQNLIQSTGSATPLNVIYISLITLLFAYILSKLFSYFPGYDIFDIAEYLGGKGLKIFLQFLFIIYLIGMAGLVLRAFALNLQIIYFTNIDIATILLVFLIAAVIVCKLGFKAVIKGNLIFLPLILLSMLILFASTLNNFGIEHFLPALGYGFNETFITGTSNIYAFSGVDILFLLIPYLKNPKDFKKISLISIGISAIHLFLAVIASMFLVPSNLSFEPIFTVYFAARRISLGSFLERLDPLFIFIWIISIFSYLSIWIYFITNIFKKATKLKVTSPMTYAFATLIFSVALIITNAGQLINILSTLYKYVPLIFSFVLCFGILILAVIKKKCFDKTNKTMPATADTSY